MCRSWIAMLAAFSLACVGTWLQPPLARAANIQNGASIVSTSTGDFVSASFQHSLRDLAATGANSVSLVIPYHQQTVQSSTVFAGSDTPSDIALGSAIDYAHSLGLKVLLNVHVDSYDGQWRAYINPSDTDAWFASYGGMLVHYAQIAQSHGAESYCIGTELIDLTAASHTSAWLSMIAQIRQSYSGILVYGADRSEIDQVGFWGVLDEIGISAYWSVGNGDGSRPVSELVGSWESIDQSQIQPLAQRYHKPVIFTEVGYRSVYDAHTAPWDYNLSGSSDEQEQANDYAAVFQFVAQSPDVSGTYIWQWQDDPNAGGTSDTGYTPQNKLAQAVMAQWYKAGGVQPVAPPSLSVSAVASSALNSGMSASISAVVTNSAGELDNALVDLEIYDTAGHQVAQQYIQGQMLKGSQTYTISWTPTVAGMYSLKAGIFTSGWAQNLLWDNAVATLNVDQPVAKPVPVPNPSPEPVSSIPVSTGQINVWWPVNGVSISGVQPFKAQLSGVASVPYTMYWQVDGGQLNVMSDSQQDGPHKESLVDLSAWNWHGSGPYQLTFVAKNAVGGVLASQSDDITIP